MCECSNSLPLELDTIGKELKEVKGNVLAAEQAEVLYHLCWRSLKALNSKNTRLLALVYILSALKENASSCLSSSQVLSENYWAAHFHQASIGAYHNLRLLTCSTAKHKAQMASKIKGDEAVLRGTATDPCTLLRRIVPASIEGLEACVSNFFESLPSATVVCMSLLEGSYTSLLEELAHKSSGLHGWMLLSHLNGDYQPAVVLLPLNSILQDNFFSIGEYQQHGEVHIFLNRLLFLSENLDEDKSSKCSIFGENNVLKEWQSPWGSSAVVDYFAPLVNMIFRASYISSSSLPEEKSEKKGKTWWKERVRLDGCLRKLLRHMEESWFGPWKFLLPGRGLDSEPLDSAVKELVHEIKVGLRSVVNESILKVVIGSIKSNNLEQERIPWHFLKKSCYINRVEDGNEDKCRSLDKAYDGADSVSGSLLELMVTTVNKLEAEYCTHREPVILVLDSDIQMLPWENMPSLTEQEVYRMPSVASILVTLQWRSALEEAVKLAGTFPLIDPLDAFYLLNPSSDCSNTQTTFEDWLRFQNMQGKAGTVPSPQELRAALQNHELFLYFGHASGTQYLHREEIQKLENCAAALLMGCSSGSIELHGYYAPTNTSISYTLAGSPFVVGNLWEVTAGEIDRFARALLKSFVDERSKSTTGCIQCSLLAEEFKSMSVSRRQNGNTKKGRGQRKAVEEAKLDISGGYCFRHNLRVADFVSQARNACNLPFLSGAAAVCHGVPSGIKKKRDS